MDSRKRTILKAVLWNVLGLFSMGIVGYLTTGSMRLGGGMALANTLIGFTFYVGYERIWSRIVWGRHV